MTDVNTAWHEYAREARESARLHQSAQATRAERVAQQRKTSAAYRRFRDAFSLLDHPTPAHLEPQRTSLAFRGALLAAGLLGSAELLLFSGLAWWAALAVVGAGAVAVRPLGRFAADLKAHVSARLAARRAEEGRP